MTKWKDILETAKIPEKYHNDCIILCDRILEKEDDPDKTDLIGMTLRVLSKIDLSKVEFTDNINFREDYSIKIAFKIDELNDLKFYGIDINAHILSLVSEEMIQYIDKKIKETGGMIIYNIVNNYCMVVDSLYPTHSIVIRGKMIDFKAARYAKILKLKQKIYQNKIISI